MNRRIVLLLVFLFLIGWPLGLWGSEESGHGQGSLNFIGKVINFVLLFGGLAFLLFKPLRAFLRGRTEEIRKTLGESEEIKRQAALQLHSAQERLAGLEKEVEVLRKAAEEEGRAEQERIRRLARQEAEKIKRLTGQDVEAQVRAGIRALKRYAADLAAERALGRLKKRMTPESQARLIDRSIEELSRADEKEDTGPKIRPRAH